MSVLPQRLWMVIGAGVLVCLIAGCAGSANGASGKDAVEVMPAENRQQYEDQMRQRMQPGGGAPPGMQPGGTAPGGMQPGGVPPPGPR
ncbi:MAG: hypothetical protein ACK47B_02830 [Armatimonadota bacterium]